MKKKALTLILAVTMTASLVACGSSESSSTSTSGSTSAGTEAGTGSGSDTSATSADSVLKDGNVVTLKMVFPGSNASPADEQAVEDAINSYIADKIDAKIDLQIVEWGSFVDQSNLMLSSGEDCDIIFSVNKTSTYQKSGQILDITDLVSTYAPDAEANMGNYFDACKIGGKLYGLPSYHEFSTRAGLICRTDVLEETGFDYSNVKTWEDLEPLFDKVKELHPDMNVLCPADLEQGVLEFAKNEIVDVVSTSYPVGIRVDGSDPDTIVDLFETDDYMDIAKLAYDWNQKGYFIPDATTNTTTRQDYLRAGTVFGYIGGTAPQVATQEYVNSGVNVTVIPVHEAMASTASVIMAQYCLPIQCKAPEKALAFLNLLYSDPTVQNLFHYGIEGTDYIMADGSDNTVTYPEGVDGTNVGWSNEMWLTGYAPAGYQMDTDPEDYYTVMNDFNDNGVRTSMYGFVFDNSNVQNEIAAISNVVSKYQAVIESGYSKPEEAVPKFIDELQSAGMQNIIDECQTQYNTWKSAQ